MLFFFDEVRSLYLTRSVGQSVSEDAFLLTRAAMGSLPFHSSSASQPDVFVVVSDTSSKISNLAPAARVDGAKLLFPPYSLIKTLDVFWRAVSDVSVLSSEERRMSSAEILKAAVNDGGRLKQVLVSSSDVAFRNSLTLEDIEDCMFMAMFGRPFFLGYLLAPGDADKKKRWQSLQRFLDRRLFGAVQEGESRPDAPPSLATSRAMAVLSVLAAVDVGARSDLASELAASHLRIVGGGFR